MGHLFYGEGIFLTLCTCTPRNSRSLFPIICHLLLHFLFLYYTVSILKICLCLIYRSIIETLKVHKVGFVQIYSLFCQLYYFVFILNMRIVNILCISKEKVLRHYVNLIVKIFAESFEITLDGGRGKGNGGCFECQLRTSRSGVCLDQNLMFVDRGGAAGR